MQGLIGLLLYVAVMVLSGIMKKLAEEKARQARAPALDDGDSYTVTLAEMLAEEVPGSADVQSMHASQLMSRIGESELKRHHTEAVDAWDDWEDSARPGVSDEREFAPEPQILAQSTRWEEAVVLAEIIREPRAKRPWPMR
ncbi:MAG: hypothetical protein QM372_08390 [Bacillota bacterium]|jgi:hypothetical protein|nr:hypothetical protein [Bacillota bacterium]